jgi:tetratricopeptide (TPR) repeat protein
MRISVICLSMWAFLSSGICPHAFSEVIHLKNGRTIWADHVRDTGTHLEYEVGESAYAIPKSLVDHVDSGGVAPGGAATAGENAKQLRDLPEFAPAVNLRNDSTLTGRIIREDHVDGDALTALEQSGDSASAAAGFFIAGKHEMDRGNFVQARTYLESALRFESDNPTVLNYYAALLVRTGNASEALPYAQRAVRAAPDSPDALTVLGYAQFAADRTQDAIATWKHSLAVRPDPVVQKYLEKAQRDATAEADFSQHESSHFTLKYEGQQTSDVLRSQLVATLESEYDDLVRTLGIAPRHSIAVVLYTEQSFFDVTLAPSWSGAVFDGKLRVPISGLTSVTPELARVLKHELAHSFISQLSNGRCPQWLNEGIAQAVEPKPVTQGQLLASLFRTQHEIPLNFLEGSFMQFNNVQATVAYEESLAAVQFIAETYSMSDLPRILERLGQGSSTETALRATIHSDYGQLEADLGKYLTSRYGN